jgi:hypothetical protein
LDQRANRCVMAKLNNVNLADLPPAERAVCYRQFARQAETWADNARTPELGASYRLLAAQWDKLAGQIAPASEDYPSSMAIQAAQTADPGSDQRR